MESPESMVALDLPKYSFYFYRAALAESFA